MKFNLRCKFLIPRNKKRARSRIQNIGQITCLSFPPSPHPYLHNELGKSNGGIFRSSSCKDTYKNLQGGLYDSISLSFMYNTHFSLTMFTVNYHLLMIVLKRFFGFFSLKENYSCECDKCEKSLNCNRKNFYDNKVLIDVSISHIL